MFERMPTANEKLADFLEQLDTLLEFNKGICNGWFGFVNPGNVPIDEIEAKIRQVTEDSGLRVDVFEYPDHHENTISWFELVEKDKGINAPLIILKPAAADYGSEQQRADHFAFGMQAYGLSVRNRAHEHGHGIIIIAPEGISPAVYTPTRLANPDLTSYASLTVNLG